VHFYPPLAVYIPSKSRNHFDPRNHRFISSIVLDPSIESCIDFTAIMTEVMEPAVDPLSKATALAELLAKAIEELRSMKPQEKSNTEPESSVKKDSHQMQPQAQPRDEKSKFNPRGTSPFVVVQSSLTTFFDEPSDDGEVSEASQESSQRRSSFSRYDTVTLQIQRMSIGNLNHGKPVGG